MNMRFSLTSRIIQAAIEACNQTLFAFCSSFLPFNVQADRIGDYGDNPSKKCDARTARARARD
jgi:hypothetical protein